ncbi:uncharacterized protein LOC110693248 [Chenopodium quinoa]|uniref:uncharacterized protein LOC110693248 n=1 Tax=Chenopodium quinoa TaxID=63459 RepID=UPI000B78BBA1|nr:uncharacterized protein LOC110693248 [Chenopodium quinoa]
MPIDPPPIKIGLGRPRKNRIKDLYENPKKSGSLTRTGIEMTCSLYQIKGNNKRKCPNKDNVQPPEPAPKRARGRPRKDAEHTATAAAPQPTPTSVQSTQATPSSKQQIDTTHHSLTAQPTMLGRGGRTIIMGRGLRGGRGRGGAAGNAERGRGSDVAGSSRGASSGNRGVGRGRGSTRGRNRVPEGVGVYIASDGSAMTSTQANQRRTTSAMGWFQCSQESQRSTLHQPTQ